MKKGFTLIELLAVITILSIISLAIIPAIIKQIAKETNDIDTTTTSLIFKAADLYFNNDENYEKTAGNRYCIKLETLVNAGYLDKKITNFKNGKQIPLSRVLQADVNSYHENEYQLLSSKQTCTEIIDPNGGKTHKGIVYLDPTDLSKKCTKEQVDANVNSNGTPTGIKTGCMKWYIYKEEGTNYRMILDHNTTPLIRWVNDDNSTYTELGQSNLNYELQALVNTYGWKVIPTLISKNEITTITGNTKFNQNNVSSLKDVMYFLDLNSFPVDTSSANFLDSVTNVLPFLTDPTKHSKYDWLYNNMDCTNIDEETNKTYYMGCSVEDKNKYELYGDATKKMTIDGYWTKTTIRGTEVDDYDVFVVNPALCSISMGVTSTRKGLRPVIVVPKTQVTKVQ